MSEPREIPQLATELVDMSREYLRQETIEPAKRLGRQAGLGLGGSLLISFGAFLGVLALYFLLRLILPAGRWYEVLARLLTAVGAAGAAGIVVWRMSK